MRRHQKLFLATIAVGFALSSLVPQASAQQRYYSDDDDVMEAPAPPPPRRRRARAPIVQDLGMEQQCEKLCPGDTSPCDPPEFKRSDGRCNGGVGGFR